MGDTGNLRLTIDESGKPKFSYFAEMPDQILWTWLRKMLIEDSAFVAKMTGIPEIANLQQTLPRPDLELRELIRAYQSHGPIRWPI